MQYQNIYRLFKAQTAKYHGATVFYERFEDKWSEWKWFEFADEVHNFACALLASGLTKGAAVAILAGNLPEWTIADIGTIAAGGIGVGIYPTSSAEQCSYIINHSDAEFVVVDTEIQLKKILAVRSQIPNVKKIVVIDNNRVIEQEDISTFEEFQALGHMNFGKFRNYIENLGDEIKSEDIAIMVYTSGTTGQPKGAMLSHQYVLNSVESLKNSVPIFAADVSFSYLPGCHVAERISGIYNRLYNGTPAHFVDDLTKLYAYMLEVRPTVFASLPRFFEKIYAKVVSEFGCDASEQDLKDAFGGNVRLLTSGGAPLPNEIAAFFAARNLPILQAYGLTENICVAFNTVENLKFGTVGKAMPMCEIKIAGDGEILVKSPMTFSGYYKEAKQTAAMFDENGWLKTGDLGELDREGFLKITGRKKEIIVLSSGKNVAPALLENLVKVNHLVSQCFVSGDNRSYCVALITLNQTEAEAFARANEIEFENFAGLTKNERISASVEAAISKANAKLSSPEQIKKFVILERDFSLEKDEITPTLKLKRSVVSERFQKEIEHLYD